MNDPIYAELRETLTSSGAASAVDRLCSWLRDQKDYHGLFYALLMKKRVELGVSPIPTSSAQDLPVPVQESLEEGIRQACNQVGRMCLDAGKIPEAWVFYRMLQEPAPVLEALEKYQPSADEDIQPLIQVALYEGVHPRKGFGWILERYGICNAITTLGSQEIPGGPEVRLYCTSRLIQALYRELVERLSAEIERRETKRPEPVHGARPLRNLLVGRDWLFEEEFAHIDVSHLSSVVQMSVNLAAGEDLDRARELCLYGTKLSPRLRYPADPPFEDQYRDYGVYLDILAGHQVEEGIAHFRKKAQDADPETIGTYPAQVLVNLLLRLDRLSDALAVARQYLASTDNRMLSCPSLVELCQKANDYKTLAETAADQGDAVHFMAGLIAEGQLANKVGRPKE